MNPAHLPVEAIVDRLIAQEAQTSERRLNRIRLGMVLVMLFVLLPIRTVVHVSSDRQDLPWMVGLFVLALGLALLIEYRLRSPRSARVGFLAIALDFGTMLGVIASQIPDGYYPEARQSVDVFALAIPAALVLNALAGLRLSHRQAMFSGLMTALVVAEAILIDVFVHGGPFYPYTTGVLAVLVVVTTLGARGMIEKTRSLLLKGATEAAEAEHVKDVFARYVSRSVAETILESSATGSTGRRERVTVLFADIRGFTRIAEKRSPEEVVSLLNRYFSCMVEVIFEYDGMLDKYLGDGMMAIFGAPVRHEDHALRAVLTALKMRSRLEDLNAQLAAADLPTLEVGIGLHTGEVIVGNIGTEQRLDYTAIGDTVNTASRIEGLTKEVGASILASGATYAEVMGHVEARCIPAVPIRGKTQSLDLFAITGARSQTLPAALTTRLHSGFLW